MGILRPSPPTLLFERSMACTLCAMEPLFPAMSLVVCVDSRVAFCLAIGAPTGFPNRPVGAGSGTHI